MNGKRPIGVDLFCGAGGMSLGFEQAGFDVVAAVDANPIHVAIHKENFPDCETIEADLSKLSGAMLRSKAGLEEKRIDVLFGGPPCGGFSLMGNRDSKDPRNELLEHFARLIAELRPRYFVVENVGGILINPMTEYIEAFKTHTAKAGYTIVDPIQILDASDFGVPQRRKRIFILGYEKGPAPEYPISPFNDNGDLQHTTVWDAIGDLPDVNDLIKVLKGDVYDGELPFTESRYARMLRGEDKDLQDLSRVRKRNGNGLTGCGWIDHTPKVVRRFAATEPGTREPISKFYRLSKDGLATTLRAGTDSARGSHSAARPIHPVHPRCITVREGARLHSFPDWFQFHSTKWHGFRQVGNSVPPLLARAVARVVWNALNVCVEKLPED